MSTEPIDLDAAQTLADAATPGPWTAITSGIANGDHWYICDGGESIAMISANDGINEDQREPDAEFIAQARTLVPALIDACRTLLDAASAGIAAESKLMTIRQLAMAPRYIGRGWGGGPLNEQNYVVTATEVLNIIEGGQ
ncbi:hypothetical protein L1080_004485 [Rhodococcus sp. MSC1_016]|uniref:hypothetical protein n=1 Tax=Rhodococcus sp. MSC1_016 TaxID=2909266 RepID=UPI00202F7EEB|nr:hypothetical protein [Rhodococcus sp. MSC1_016]